MNRRDIFSAFSAALLAGSTVYVAGHVLSFERMAAATRGSITRSQGSLDPRARDEALAVARSWSTSPFVAGRARSLVIDLELTADEPDTRQLERDLLDLAMLKPTNGSTWQSLAQLRLVNGASPQDVLPLVRTSAVMAPYDGYVMVPRAVFSIQNWRTLPEADRARTIRDITGVTRAEGATFQWSVLPDVIAAQDTIVRTDLRDRLAAALPGDSRTLRQLGL